MRAMKSAESDTLLNAAAPHSKNNSKTTRHSQSHPRQSQTPFAQLLGQTAQKPTQQTTPPNPTSPNAVGIPIPVANFPKQKGGFSLQRPAGISEIVVHSEMDDRIVSYSADEIVLELGENEESGVIVNQNSPGFSQSHQPENIRLTGEIPLGIETSLDVAVEDLFTPAEDPLQGDLEVLNPPPLAPDALDLEVLGNGKNDSQQASETQVSEIGNYPEQVSPIAANGNLATVPTTAAATGDSQFLKGNQQFDLIESHESLSKLEIPPSTQFPSDGEDNTSSEGEFRRGERETKPVGHSSTAADQDGVVSLNPHGKIETSQNLGFGNGTFVGTDDVGTVSSAQGVPEIMPVVTPQDELASTDQRATENLNSGQANTIVSQSAHPREQSLTLENRGSLTASSAQSASNDSITHQAVTNIVQAIEGGKAIRMRMNPPELGLLNIEIASVNGSLTARLDVESPQVHRILVDNLSHLQEMLGRAHAQVERIEFNILDVPSGTSNPSQNAPSFSSAGHQRNEQSPQPIYRMEPETETSDDRGAGRPETTGGPMRLLSGIDIHA